MSNHVDLEEPGFGFDLGTGCADGDRVGQPSASIASSKSFIDTAKYFPHNPPLVAHTVGRIVWASEEYLQPLVRRVSMTLTVALARLLGWPILAHSCWRVWSRFQPVTSTT